MKNIQSLLYVFGALFFPVIACAHGGVDDGHVEPVDAPNPESRSGVIIGLVVFAALFAGFIWYSKRQNPPTPPTTPTPPTPPVV